MDDKNCTSSPIVIEIRIVVGIVIVIVLGIGIIKGIVRQGVAEVLHSAIK